jgi:pyruvate dehydrogenase E1 component alpha subunit
MAKIDKKRQLWIYKTMNEIRFFEEKAYEFFAANKLRGSVHLYTGEEAIASAIISQLSDEDYITSTHRGHGHGASAKSRRPESRDVPS